jgi:putative endonuclease
VLPGECPPHSSPHALGRIGEELAAAHLVRLGFKIIARNVRTRHGEIDLIAYDGSTLVFAEVKSRRGSPRGPGLDPAMEPLAGLRAPQCARLRRLAAAWLNDSGKERPSARDIRFDAIGVTLDRQDRLLSLDHLEAAW